MAKQKSFFAGAIGLLIFTLSLFGFLIGLVGFGTLFIVSLLQNISFELVAIFAGFGLVGLIISIIGLIIGLKLIIENENRFFRIYLGLIGIILFISGLVITFISGLTAIFVGLILALFGIILVSWGFKIKQLKPINKILIKSIKALPSLNSLSSLGRK